MAKGWISIHRKIEDCQIWLGNEPYDRRSAWISILLMANHEDKDILFDGQMVTVKRGQFITSVRHLGQKWMWSKDRTLRYLRLLLPTFIIYVLAGVSASCRMKMD